MTRICVKCGRKGTRDFAIRRGRGDKDDYETVEEWECANHHACALRQIRDGSYDVTGTSVWTPDGGKEPREIAAEALAADQQSDAEGGE